MVLKNRDNYKHLSCVHDFFSLYSTVVINNLSSEPLLDELKRIYQNIRPHIRITPILELDRLSQLIQGRVFVKAECLQKTGAFKFRGALHRLMSLSTSEKQQGVAAYSSGNFASGLATAGRLLGIKVNLVMPHDAPNNKIKSARDQGAVVILCKSNTPSREEAASNMASELADKNQQVLLHPFDDLQLIKGQASLAIELEEQLRVANVNVHDILCPVGGGSLLAGTSMVLHKRINITAVEPKGFAGMTLSLTKGEKTRDKGDQPCDCDALQALEPGNANLKIVQNKGHTGLTVSPQKIREAMNIAFHDLDLVLEPSGAIALAAVLEHPHQFKGKNLVAIATGGNVDHSIFTTHLNSASLLEPTF